MTSVQPPDGSGEERVTARRVAIFVLVALAVVLGLYFYFRDAGDVTPVLGMVSLRS